MIFDQPDICWQGNKAPYSLRKGIPNPLQQSYVHVPVHGREELDSGTYTGGLAPAVERKFTRAAMQRGWVPASWLLLVLFYRPAYGF